MGSEGSEAKGGSGATKYRIPRAPEACRQSARQARENARRRAAGGLDLKSQEDREAIEAYPRRNTIGYLTGSAAAAPSRWIPAVEIAFGSLSYNGYDSNVSSITDNVPHRRFAAGRTSLEDLDVPVAEQTIDIAAPRQDGALEEKRETLSRHLRLDRDVNYITKGLDEGKAHTVYRFGPLLQDRLDALISPWNSFGSSPTRIRRDSLRNGPSIELEGKNQQSSLRIPKDK